MANMQNRRRIFNLLHQAIGMTPKVLKYYADGNSADIDIYLGVDRPDVEITTYSTIGLSDYPIGLSTQEGKTIRVEFISMCKSESEYYGNILASCAFNIINDNYTCKPGIVYPNIITKYYNNSVMKHMYFTSPFSWPTLQKIEDDDKVVLWLLAIPISDEEFDYLHENGIERFEELLESHDIKYYDINRQSIL